MSAAPFTWKGGRLNFTVEGNCPRGSGCPEPAGHARVFPNPPHSASRRREFTNHDNARPAKVAIVNEAMVAVTSRTAESLSGEGCASMGPGLETEWITVIGVVGDVKEMGIVAAAQPVIYLPPAQTQRGLQSAVRSRDSH